MSNGHSHWATFRRMSAYCLLAAVVTAGPAVAQAEDGPAARSRAARIAEAERWEFEAESWKREAEQWRQEAGLWQDKANNWRQQAQEWEAKAGAWEQQAAHWQHEAEARRAEVEPLDDDPHGQRPRTALSDPRGGRTLRNLNEHERPDYAGDRHF